MADLIELDEGSSGKYANTDDCGAAGHVQGVKLCYSADGVATYVTADDKGIEVQQATAADLNVTEASASAIKTALEIIDDWDASDHCNIRHLNTTDDAVAIADGGNTITVDNGGTFAVQATLGAETTKVIGTVNVAAAQTIGVTQATASSLNAAVVGAVAHDGSTASNPVVAAGRSLALGSATTDVNADGDVVNLLATRGGRLYVSTAHPNRWHACVDDHNTAQTNHLLQAATGSASTSLYVTDINISNGATAGDVKLMDGSGGTVLYHAYLAINGGCAVQLHTPIKLTANTGLYFTSTTVTTHTVSASGFTSSP